VLLLDDDDALPSSRTDEEASFAALLTETGLRVVDANLTGSTRSQWLKVASIVHAAVKAGGYDVWNEGHLHLHVRRVIDLVARGVLESKGDLHRPRWSEVRLAKRM